MRIADPKIALIPIVIGLTIAPRPNEPHPTQEAGAVVATTGRFDLHSNPRIALHHFLIGWASADAATIGNPYWKPRRKACGRRPWKRTPLLSGVTVVLIPPPGIARGAGGRPPPRDRSRPRGSG